MKKKLIIGSIVVVLIAAFVGVGIAKNNGSIPAFGGGNAIEVKVKKIEKGSISSSVSASGVIEEVEKAQVFFETPMKVNKKLVDKNQKVTKGQKLVELDMDSINSQIEQLKGTKTLQELTIKKTRAMDGTRSTGALEAGVVIAENNIKSAENTYNDSKKTYEDNKKLFDAAIISKTELDRYEKAMRDSEMALKNARLSYQTSADSLKETQKSNAQTNSNKNIDLQTAEQTLKNTILQITDLENRIKKINEWATSPIDGVITDVNVEDGAFTSAAMPAFVIVNPDKLKVKADVKEFDIRNVAVGQQVNITGDAVNKEDGVTGKIESISTMAKKNKTATGDETLIEITVSIDKVIPVLKPGLSVTCDIITKVKTDAVLGSFEMLKEDKDGNKSVIVLDEKTGTLQEKPIKIGLTSELSVELTDGVKDGDMVVLNPQPTHKAGAKAKVIKDEKK